MALMRNPATGIVEEVNTLVNQGTQYSGYIPVAPGTPLGSRPVLSRDEEIKKLQEDPSFAGGTFVGRTPKGLVDLGGRPTIYDTQGNLIPSGSAAGGNPYTEFTKPVDPQAIRDEIIKSQQASIDAITRSFAAIEARRTAEELQAGKKEEARVHGLNISGGVAGSPVASTRASTAEANTRSRVQAVRDEIGAQRDAQIQTILGNASARAEQLIQAKEQARMGAIEKSQAFVEKIKNEATKDLETIAGSGKYTFDQFKGSDAYDQLVTQSGMTPQKAELYFNAKMPQAQASDFKWDDGKAFQYDRATGDFKRRPDLDTATGAGGYIEKDGFLYPTKNGKTITFDPSKPKDEQIFEVGQNSLVTAQKKATLEHTQLQNRKLIEDLAGGEDAGVQKDLQDAAAAIDAGANPDKVRQRFLDSHPKKGDLYLKYTKQAY